ncbi:MAG: acyl-CoA dehydrogenase family protein, partial [Synergistaceae bacterium]|nr:acyl-CoA dehydrogenase family protein [Synergistaceae bacterium]
MSFRTTEEHEALRARLRDFAETEIKPLAFLLDKENAFPDDAVRKLGEMGLMGIPFPKEYGGAGLDTL